MAEKYLWAKRNETAWHYNYMAKYFDITYDLVDSVHFTGNEERKSNPESQYLFAEPTKELEFELREFGMEYVYKTKRIKLK
jgi:hypothetical protein